MDSHTRQLQTDLRDSARVLLAVADDLADENAGGPIRLSLISQWATYMSAAYSHYCLPEIRGTILPYATAHQHDFSNRPPTP